MQPGSLGQIVSDVNRQLTADVEETGRFMTLFYGEIDSGRRTIRWVRAGHEPAVLFDPQTNTFEALKGPGLALGLDPEWIYAENVRENLKDNQILLLCTDGVWEAHNRTGEMFGKEALLEVIRRNWNLSAAEIVAAVISSVKQFQAGVKPEDDITLVVAKLIQPATA
jgi:sigma-B regulation protein RsbU (phosphoserine phosphatase)